MQMCTDITLLCPKQKQKPDSTMREKNHITAYKFTQEKKSNCFQELNIEMGHRDRMKEK